MEDFARLQLYTGGLNDSFKNGTLYIGLKWTDVSSGAPAVKLYKNYETGGGTGYLNDPDIADSQVGVYGDGHVAIKDASQSGSRTVVDSSGVFVLPSALFAGLTDSDPKTHLLFEGCHEGKGQLKLVILKKENGAYTEIGEGPGVWLDLQEPNKFIQRWTCGDGDRTPVTSYTLDTSKSGTFAAPTKDEEKDFVLYVHGYNMQEFEKQRWIETTYKRLYWLGFKGRVGGFTWPCAQSAIPFDASEERAWQSGAQLNALLASLKSQGYRVHVIAHSQGNVVMGEALRQAGPNSALVSTYIASQAAIPAHCYDASQPDRNGPTAFTPTTPNVYARYWTSIQDAHLPETWGSLSPSYLATTYVQGAADKFVNFYNPQDWALTGNGVLPLADDGSQPGWLANQRLKPDNGYDYVSYIGFRDSPLFSFNPKQYAFPDDRFTIFAYCAEARSLALGSTSTGGVFAGSEVNLFGAPYNYRNQHIYHSGEFRSFYAQRWQYWQSVMDACNLDPRAKP